MITVIYNVIIMLCNEIDGLNINKCNDFFFNVGFGNTVVSLTVGRWFVT